MGGTMRKHRTYGSLLLFSVVFSLIACISPQLYAQTQRGVELYNSAQYPEAERALRDALKVDASDILANYYLGLLILPQEKNSEALDIFLKIQKSEDRTDQRKVRSVPSEFQVQIALARARLGLKQYVEAWKNLESARAQDNRSSDVYVYRGVYYLQQEKHSEAIREFEKAIKLDAKNPYAFYYEGLAYYGSGNPAKAVDALKNFLQLAPYAPEAPKAKDLITKLC
jgi:tetratricopeptide (TPR) repeat protein